MLLLLRGQKLDQVERRSRARQAHRFGDRGTSRVLAQLVHSNASHMLS
jgi:hypothetical protein